MINKILDFIGLWAILNIVIVFIILFPTWLRLKIAEYRAKKSWEEYQQCLHDRDKELAEVKRIII